MVVYPLVYKQTLGVPTPPHECNLDFSQYLVIIDTILGLTWLSEA